MISHQYMSDHPEVDWSVYNSQQNLPSPSAMKNSSSQRSSGVDSQYQDSTLGNRQSPADTVNTFLGPMPNPKSNPLMQPNSPQSNDQIGSLINSFAGVPGMNVIQKGLPAAANLANEAGTAAKNYLFPERN